MILPYADRIVESRCCGCVTKLSLAGHAFRVTSPFCEVVRANIDLFLSL